MESFIFPDFAKSLQSLSRIIKTVLQRYFSEKISLFYELYACFTGKSKFSIY